jgi:lysophospholipase L1-like esterase
MSVGCTKQKYTWSTEEEYFQVPIWKQHVKQFKKMNYPVNTVTLFIGDSMTEGFDLNRHLKKDSLVNMGISGDFTSGILKRLDPVEKLQPHRIFIMIGINDILKSVPLERIKSQYEEIIVALKQRCPNAAIYIQSNLPTTNMGGNAIANAEVVNQVKSLNTFNINLCEKYQVQFINLYPLFETDNNELVAAYTYDGLHLSDEGYKVWANEVDQLLSR